ncbi:MAG TPA: type II toxin-antitoxin system VapC family toxin [Vicinamibacterales bacterium]|nr:type II toxin-antitoxin system VapC family toxin [Vicinamibacterales bacterium]
MLLDTHTLLWWLNDSPEITKSVGAALRSAGNAKFVSVVSIWEIRLKAALGKLDLPKNFRTVLDRQPIEQLPILPDHAHEFGELPLHHRDPFDRMLVAQARVENLTMVTRDPRIREYDIAVLAA